MTKYSKLTLAAAAIAATMAGSSTALAQSADALIDKLVDKGILTVKEANDLREETDKGFTTAYSVKSGMPEWVTALKFNGDFRGRYESFNFDADTTARNRFRYRARLGFTATIKDQFVVGFRLTSDEAASGVNGGDPLSGNTTFGDNAAKKLVYIDLAYGKWSPLSTAEWTGTITAGKMENPFLFPSTMMFDRDYTAEGAALELSFRPNAEHSVKLTGGGFMLDERNGNSDNPYMGGAQLRWDALWNKHFSSSLGVSMWGIASGEGANLANGQVPNQNSGNTRNAAGELVNDYTPVQADASVTYTMDKFPMYPTAFPITVFGEYIQNTAISDRNIGYAAGVTFGKSGKKGTWDLGYQYRNLEGDAWFEELSESDFGANYLAAPVGGTAGYRSGTNVRGHIIKAQYSPYDCFTLGVTYWLTDLIDENPAGSKSGSGRLQLDAVLKF